MNMKSMLCRIVISTLFSMIPFGADGILSAQEGAEYPHWSTVIEGLADRYKEAENQEDRTFYMEWLMRFTEADMTGEYSETWSDYISANADREGVRYGSTEFAAKEAFEQSCQEGLLDMGFAIFVEPVAKCIDLVCLTADAASTAAFDYPLNYDPMSDSGEGAVEAIEAGTPASLEIAYRLAHAVINNLTVGLYNTARGAYVYYETGDPEEWRKAAAAQLESALIGGAKGTKSPFAVDVGTETSN